MSLIISVSSIWAQALKSDSLYVTQLTRLSWALFLILKHGFSDLFHQAELQAFKKSIELFLIMTRGQIIKSKPKVSARASELKPRFVPLQLVALELFR